MWTDAREAEFIDHKDVLLSPDTMLYHQDWNNPFEIHTDASKHGIETMLAQWHNGKLHPVKCFFTFFYSSGRSLANHPPGTFCCQAFA